MMRFQQVVGKTAPVLESPVSNVDFILGPYADIALNRQPIIEFKTRLHVNANVKPVKFGLANLAKNTSSLAQLRTRLRTPLVSTGAKGNPVVAQQSLLTGRNP